MTPTKRYIDIDFNVIYVHMHILEHLTRDGRSFQGMELFFVSVYISFFYSIGKGLIPKVMS